MPGCTLLYKISNSVSYFSTLRAFEAMGGEDRNKLVFFFCMLNILWWQLAPFKSKTAGIWIGVVLHWWPCDSKCLVSMETRASQIPGSPRWSENSTSLYEILNISIIYMVIAKIILCLEKYIVLFWHVWFGLNIVASQKTKLLLHWLSIFHHCNMTVISIS